MSLLRRFGLLAVVMLVVARAPGASAQIPLPAPAASESAAVAESTPVSDPPPASPPPAPDPALAPLPAPPTAPPGAAAPPSGAPASPGAAAPPSGAPAPTRADHLARPAVEESDLELDDAPLGGRRRRSWYGWQTLIADGASIAVFLTGVAIQSESGSDGGGGVLATAGLAGYEFVPGFVHFGHGNPGRGFASFGIRLGMPIGGAILGAAMASGCDDFLCEAGGAGIGILLGMGGAMAIDAAVFAYDDPLPRWRGRRLVPLVALAPKSAWLGLGGELQ